MTRPTELRSAQHFHALCPRALVLVLVLVLRLRASDAQGDVVPGTGTVDDPWLYSTPEGSFDDGSGALGTYANNMDGWWLLNPCAESTSAGRPCTVLVWFELFETEENYDQLSFF